MSLLQFSENGSESGQNSLPYVTKNSVRCALCEFFNPNLRTLNNHLKIVHAMKPSEYVKLTGHGYQTEDFKKEVSERISGKNNPAYGHGGKLSPFSSKFVKGDISSETKKKASKTRVESHGNTSTLEYWTIRMGLSEEDARKKLSERQSTFSFEKCVEKYGEEEGTIRWKKRQEKWLKTLDSKSDEEKDRIRKAKAPRFNLRILRNMIRGRKLSKTEVAELEAGFMERAKQSRAFVYVVRIDDMLKIGFSIQPLVRVKCYQKYALENGVEFELLSIHEFSSLMAYLVEQSIHRELKKNRARYGRYNGQGLSEIYENVDYETVIELIRRYSSRNEDELMKEMIPRKRKYEKK